MKLRIFGLSRGESEEDKILSGEEALGHIGVHAIYYQSIKDRIEALDELMDQFYNEKDPVKKLNIANKIITVVVLPWARGGDNPYFQKMIMYWNQLVALVKSWAIYREKADPESREELEGIYRSIIEQEVGALLQTVVSASFYDKDLAKNIVTVIQTIVPPGVERNTDRGEVESRMRQDYLETLKYFQEQQKRGKQ